MDEVKERGSAVATEVAERAREFTHEAMHKAQEFSAAAPEQLRRTAGFNNPVCHNQTDTSLPPEPIESTFASGDQNAKNQLLLGTAGLAIVLALGISFRRRFIEN
jgi:hypothetical protein